jgi:tight adherence protein B
MFLFTVTLFFLLVLQRFSPKKELTETRINRYLGSGTEEEKTNIQEPKKFQRAMQLRFAKQTVKKYLAKKDKTSQIETLLSQAGVPLKPEEYVMFKWISIALGAGILNLFVGNLIVIPLGAYIGSVIPKMILKKRQRARLKKFNDALPEMISTIVGALRAGFSFPQALKSVAEESSSPMKEEMELVLKEMQYGVTIEESLNKLKERMPSEDLNLMVQAILIQRQVGGNLATVLDQIANTIRERIKIHGQIKTLTAQGRMSGMVVALLPVILGGFLLVIEPNYMSVMFSNPIGLLLLGVGAVSCLIGFVFITKITAIEV